MKKKLLIIGINQKIHTTRRMIEEAEQKGISFDFIKWGSLVFFEGNIFAEGKKIKLGQFGAIFCDIPSYKLCLNKKNSEDSLYFRLPNELHEICRQAAALQLPLLNSRFVLKSPFYNKFTQAQLFVEKQIVAIPTLHLTDNRLSKIKEAKAFFGFEYPLVVKQSEGGMGRAVWLASDETELEKIVEDKRNQSLIFQPFIPNKGDFRVLVVGGKTLGIMKRVAKQGQWKNNFALGGKVCVFEDPEMEKFAEEVAHKLELDYVGLDIFKTAEGYKVIETNIFACFEGFEEVFPAVNVPAEILNFLRL